MSDPQHPHDDADPADSGAVPEPDPADSPAADQDGPVDGDLEAELVSSADDGEPTDTDDGPEAESEVDFDEFLEDDGEDAPSPPAWAQRRWSSAALAVALVIGALVVAIATWTWPDSSAGGRVVAQAELLGLSSQVGNAIAEIREDDDGRVLHIEARDLPDVADGYAQVWLTDRRQQHFLPLGVLDSESIELPLPSTLNLATLPMVEISQELFDGDPGHGGRPLWRGDLGIGE